ncbi:hypothetical protein [Polycyclovorans algicola]|uniref:hypothetical protein n=1 Tax=Polycyclovorans algicola TaxID=616992 RepID=UPI00344FE7A2
MRGGSWNNQPANLRAANRNRNTATAANNNQGFRLASPPATARLAGCPEWRHSRVSPVRRLWVSMDAVSGFSREAGPNSRARRHERPVGRPCRRPGVFQA